MVPETHTPGVLPATTFGAGCQSHQKKSTCKREEKYLRIRKSQFEENGRKKTIKLESNVKLKQN